MRAVVVAFGVVAASAWGLWIVPLGAAGEGDDCESPCAAAAEWFPVTPKPDFHKPAPDSDCEFYQWAWQILLYITQPEPGDGGGARFLSYQTKDELFGQARNEPFGETKHGLFRGAAVSRFPRPEKGRLSLAPRLAKQREPLSSGDILQAQSLGILVDQNRRAVYYAIHLNDVFSDFVTAKGFTDFVKLKFAPADLEFPRGSLEIKTSWRIVPDDEPAAVTEKYFVVEDATVARLKVNAQGRIEVDPANAYPAKVALLGIHVVGVVDGHPEFVWATFEHVDNAPDGATKEIPAMNGMPGRKNVASQDPAKPVPEDRDYTLYKKGTLAKDCNLNRPQDLKLDENKQTFTNPPVSVFRLFPFGEDEDPCTIATLNESVHRQILAQKDKVDADTFARLKVWTYYDLKGAIWLNNPAYFREGVDFASEDSEHEDKRILGGDKRLSNTTMETFTQGRFEGADIRPGLSCFDCHQTVSLPFDRNRSRAPITFPSKRLGVSHILTSGYFSAHEEFNRSMQKVEDDWAAAWSANDPTATKVFLSSGFVFVGPGGVVRTRDEHLDDLKNGVLKFVSVVPDVPQNGTQTWVINVSENAATVAYKAQVKGVFGTKDISGAYQFADNFVKESGRWSAVSRQMTPIN